MTLILQVFYSVFSGLLLSLGIPNELFLLGNPFYASIALIPYYIVIKKTKNYKQAFWFGFLQTLTVHLCSSFWLAYFKDFAIFTLGASAIATAAEGGIFALFLFLPFSRTEESPLNCFSASKKFYQDTAFRILYFAAIYTSFEWAKSSGFIGYPWGTVSSAMFRWNSLKQLASITGTYGITFLIVMMDALIVEIISLWYKAGLDKDLQFLYQSPKNALYTFLILFSLTLLWGSYEYNKERKPDKTLTTILVQQNNNPWNLEDDDETILTSEKLSEEKIRLLKAENKKPQLIVWSEGSLMHYFPGAYDYYYWYPEEKPLREFISETKTPLITGGVYKKKFTPKENKKADSSINSEVEHEKNDYKYFNSTLMFDSEGNFRGFYGKLHLVPFAELIPGIRNPLIKKIFTKVVGISAGWDPGEQLTYFEIPCSYYDEPTTPRVNNLNIAVPYDVSQKIEGPLVRIATPVCFDDAFTDVMRPLFLNGAELFVNLTDDSWSLKKSSEYQHFCIASYRAIEYRTTLVRSTNAGYSVVISPSGKILADQPLFEESALAYDVPVYNRVITTYARFGNWLPYTCIVIFILVSIQMAYTFTFDDFIPSERNKPIKLKKSSKHKKSKKSKKSKKNKK